MPEAKGFAGSAEKHRFISIDGVDAQQAREKGPIYVSTAWCGCARCCKHDFANCLMRGLCGFASKLKRVCVPRVSMSGAPSQTATLAEFAATLAKGQLRAVAVDSREVSILHLAFCILQLTLSHLTSCNLHLRSASRAASTCATSLAPRRRPRSSRRTPPSYLKRDGG